MQNQAETTKNNPTNQEIPAPFCRRATHLGMCFGVRDAIDMACQHAREKPLSMLGDLVHNESVVAQLQSLGVQIVHDIDDIKTKSVMITAHGASEKTIRRMVERGHEVIQATCPLVRHVHRIIQQLAKDGCHPIVIGKPNHVEVRGITEDLAAFDVISSEEDVLRVAKHPKFGVVCQTTHPSAHAQSLVSLLRLRFPESEVRFIDTICRPTKQRQSAAIELAKNSDVVVVIGGAKSNNTRELVTTCKHFCNRVYHAQTADDLRSEWFTNAKSIGITAGTSTPDDTIAAVETWINNIGRPNKSNFTPLFASAR